VLAGNYLQTLDWHGDANIMKIIVQVFPQEQVQFEYFLPSNSELSSTKKVLFFFQMYTKAGDMESLASFYEACAQIEIDEFRDYEKVDFCPHPLTKLCSLCCEHLAFRLYCEGKLPLVKFELVSLRFALCTTEILCLFM
jgi:hypothetical protein